MIEASSYTRKNKKFMEFVRRRRKKILKKKSGKFKKFREKNQKNQEKIRENLRKKSGFSWPAAGEKIWDLGVG